MGMLILSIPQIPHKIRNMDTGNIKNKVDSKAIKENINKLKEETKLNERRESQFKRKPINREGIYVSTVSEFTSKEKENTIFQLQILSGAFLVISILYIFNYLSLTIYGIIGVVLVAYLLYLLYYRVKLMYSQDFNAYRDFFLMYIAAGIILVLISFNQTLTMALSFSFLPSLSVLIFAVILVAAIFLIFRIRYHRDFTIGKVIESGKKTAYVKVDYDIRSNVKPDIYVVENDVHAVEEDIVKLQIEEKLFSTGGNKPISIIGTVK